MSFNVICLIGIVTALPFGAAFAFAPELTAGLYGISGWNPGTTAIGRLFGTELLYVAAALFAVRDVTEPKVQRRVAIGFGLASALAAAILAQAVLAGAANAFTWSSVAIYAFFAVAWGLLVLRQPQ